MPNLTIRDGGRERTHQIEGDSLTIGRASTNAVEIHDAKASKEHCRVECVGDRWKVVDLESKNGTRINGAYKNKAWLEHGDTIEIGRAQIRFGLEGAARTATAPSRATAPASRRQREREYEYEPEYEEERRPPPSRYARNKSTDRAIIASLVVLGCVIIFVIVSKVSSLLTRDDYNLGLLPEADNYIAKGQWNEALAYLRKNGDPDGNAWGRVERRIAEIDRRKAAFYKNRRNELAHTILSRLSRKVKAFNAGKQSATATDILKLIETLKTKYPDTENAARAKKTFDVWWDGKVPQRASDLLASGGRLRKDWRETIKRAREYEKKENFREARETIERFVTARESVLDREDLEYSREQRDENFHRIDLLADSYFRGRQGRAETLIKQKRYDRAIKIYQEIIEKFGIDVYVRKAQLEIQKIEALKPKR